MIITCFNELLQIVGMYGLSVSNDEFQQMDELGRHVWFERVK